jgi:hypothetical protein
MKKNLLVAALLVSAVSAFAQGTVTFNNRATAGLPAPVVAPIYGVDPNCPTCEKHGNTATGAIQPAPAGTQTYGGQLISGTGFTAAIWGVNVNQPDTALAGDTTPIATAAFRNAGTTASLLGFWTGSSPAVPGVVGGGADRAKFIIRVWDNRGGTVTTWQQVLADNNIPRGDSGIIRLDAALGLAPSIPAPNMVGLESFQLFTVVPEPSVIALGVLGAGCLFLLRRRK